MRKISFGILFLASLLFSSCSDSPPRLDYLEIFPVSMYHPVSESHSFLLRVFAQVHDDDGYNSLESMYVVNDERRLYWVSEREEWLLDDRSGENWILLPDLEVPRLDDISGEFRAILLDSSGTQAERSVIFGPLNIDSNLHPGISIDGGELVISSPHDEHRIRVYTSGGRLISAMHLSAERMQKDELMDGCEKVLIYIMNALPLNGIFYITGPYTIQ